MVSKLIAYLFISIYKVFYESVYNNYLFIYLDSLLYFF